MIEIESKAISVSHSCSKQINLIHECIQVISTPIDMGKIICIDILHTVENYLKTS